MPKIEQIEESAAAGDVAAFYKDFKETIHASFVPTVFRSLARFPRYLFPAWDALGPALGTAYADRAAGLLKAILTERIEPIVAHRCKPLPELTPDVSSEIRAVLETFAHVLPKSWLGILALGEVWAGRSIHGSALRTPDELLPTVRGVPPSMPAIPMLDQDPDDPRVKEIFAATLTRLDRLAVPSLYRTLARWPDYLEAVWEQVIDPGILAGIRLQLPEITSSALEFVRGLPCSLAIDRTTAEAWLPGAADEIETVLNTYRKTMPETSFQIFGLLRGFENH